MSKKYLQLPRFQTSQIKSEAVSLVERHVNEHISDFKDGEEIMVGYLNENGESVYTPAAIKINGNNAKVIAAMSDDDTLRIVEKSGIVAPEDESVIWLSDSWDDDPDKPYEASDLKSVVKEMAAELKTVREELALCKEALTNTLGGGDILLNSTKYLLENAYEPERPDGAPYPYTTGDTEIYDWDVYIGDASLDEYAEGGLYYKERYFPKVRAFNSAGEEIEITSAITVTMTCGGGKAVVTFTGDTLYANTSGDSNFHAIIEDSEHSFTDEKTYLLLFEKSEEPAYQTYNVKHLIVKHAESFDYMVEHFNYLLVGEFCWCIKENALYLKEKASNGTIQLFKINGGGSVTPTGETVTYTVTDNGILNAISSDDSINVNAEGVLTLVGSVRADGTLLLKDTESN